MPLPRPLHNAGSARVKDCLEAHRHDDAFSDECRTEVDAMIESRVRDFRLDSRLRTTCESDIYNMVRRGPRAWEGARWRGMGQCKQG